MLESIPRVDVWKKVQTPCEYFSCCSTLKKITILSVFAISAGAIIYYFWVQQNNIKQIKSLCEDLTKDIKSRLPIDPKRLKRESSDSPTFDSDDEKKSDSGKKKVGIKVDEVPNPSPEMKKRDGEMETFGEEEEY